MLLNFPFKNLSKFRRLVFFCKEKNTDTVHSPINGHSKKRTLLINGQILFPSHKFISLVWLSKKRTLLISGQKSIPQWCLLIRELKIILILKVMIKNLYCCFCIKTQYSFILNYSNVGERVGEGCRKSMESGENYCNILMFW